MIYRKVTRFISLRRNLSHFCNFFVQTHANSHQMTLTQPYPRRSKQLATWLPMVFATMFLVSAQLSTAQSCDDSAWFAISNALQKSAENGNVAKYEDAVMRAVSFQEACPDFAAIVEDLLDRTDMAFSSGQTSRQVQSRSVSETIRNEKASVLLIKANNSKIFGLLTSIAASVVVVSSPPAAIALGAAGGLSWIRSLSLERRAAKRLARDGM